MNEEAGFLQAIIASPDDDALRLIYADWLEERDRCERAEFIRVQCELASIQENVRKNGQSVGPPAEIINGLSAREEKLLNVAAAQDWSGMVGAISSWQFRRGFLEVVECKASDWETHGPSMIERYPIQRVLLRGVAIYTINVWFYVMPEMVPGFLHRHLFSPLKLEALLFLDYEEAIQAISKAAIAWAKDQAALRRSSVSL